VKNKIQKKEIEDKKIRRWEDEGSQLPNFSTSQLLNSKLNQNGSALVITLLIVALLTSLTVEFAYEVYIGTNSLSNWRNAQRASLIARTGQTLSSRYVNVESKRSYTYPGEMNLPVEKDFEPNTILTIKIEDENSKFNINSIIYPNGLTNEEALSSLKKLFEYLNINPSLALSIADWIDPDHEPRLSPIPSGIGLGDSEDRAKNLYLWSVDELNLIKGIDKKTFETIRPFITVYGNGLVNINTARLPVLVSLRDDLTETLAKRIVDYRESTPFEDTTHIQKVSGMETIGQLLLGRITTKSSNFRIISTATVNEITRVIESVMDTSMKVQYWREG
jgi:general secretion pathway protein K